MGSERWNQSAEAWISFVDSVDLNRSAVLDPVMLELVGDARGKRVLDVGCGEGRFCRLLSSQGASVTGLDPTPALIERAAERDPYGKYFEGFAEDLPFESGSFDVVVSYVMLLDVADYRMAIREFARVLRPGGKLVYANLNNFSTTAVRGWLKEGSELVCIPVDNYSFEWGAIVEWRDIAIVNYHRPMSDYMGAFLDSGLVLTRFEEPIPSPQAVTEQPRLAEYLRIRHFVAMEWQKP